ncbi:HesA/MoeB/ThiF family protein [Deinococcus sp.]|uniref:HesA/MoeB/ThiF family protein n=1 Tax=Deinococcus sp. TaxID=47478 RepID=UPI003C7C249F
MTRRPDPDLTRDELRRYSRPLLLPEWADAGAQERLKAAGVLVVGAGGLGCPALGYLVGAGVGRVDISDGDTVALSNLHRQTLYTTADLGRPKAQVAAARLAQLNPGVVLEVLPALTPEGASALVGRYDLLLDCTDNFETRYLINDACVAAGRRWVWGAAGGSEGMLSVFGPRYTLRELFPDPAGAESCDETGVLGPLLGVIGSLMAGEALKLLGGVGDLLEGQLLTYDLMNAQTRRIRLRPARQADEPTTSIL